MDNAQDILVIILSAFLALFLLLNIILLIIIIKVALVVKRVTLKAEELADKAEALGEFVQHAATPVILGKLFNNLSGYFFKGKSKRK